MSTPRGAAKRHCPSQGRYEGVTSDPQPWLFGYLFCFVYFWGQVRFRRISRVTRTRSPCRLGFQLGAVRHVSVAVERTFGPHRRAADDAAESGLCSQHAPRTGATQSNGHLPRGPPGRAPRWRCSCTRHPDAPGSAAFRGTRGWLRVFELGTRRCPRRAVAWHRGEARRHCVTVASSAPTSVWRRGGITRGLAVVARRAALVGRPRLCSCQRQGPRALRHSAAAGRDLQHAACAVARHALRPRTRARREAVRDRGTVARRPGAELVSAGLQIRRPGRVLSGGGPSLAIVPAQLRALEQLLCAVRSCGCAGSGLTFSLHHAQFYWWSVWRTA